MSNKRLDTIGAKTFRVDFFQEVQEWERRSYREICALLGTPAGSKSFSKAQKELEYIFDIYCIPEKVDRRRFDARSGRRTVDSVGRSFLSRCGAHTAGLTFPEKKIRGHCFLVRAAYSD